MVAMNAGVEVAMVEVWIVALMGANRHVLQEEIQGSFCSARPDSKDQHKGLFGSV
jgi:hypothetical protein